MYLLFNMHVLIISICACIHPAFVQARITYKLYTDAAGLIHWIYLGFNLCCCAVVVALLYLFFSGIVVIVVIFVVVVVVDVVDVVHLIFSFPHLIPSSHFIFLSFSPGWRPLHSHPYHHDEEVWSICDSERKSDAG